jgi:hypothetical protein
MKKAGAGKKGNLQKNPKISESRGSQKKEKFDCYNQCVNDPWEIKSESLCSSVCGL